MTIQTFNITGTIAIPVSYMNGDDVIEIFDGAPRSNPAQIPPYTIVSTNTFIKDLRVMAVMASLPPMPLPDIQLTDSPTEKLQKSLGLEWSSPRRQLNMLVRNLTSGGWLKVYAISLLTPMGFPFRVYSLMESYTNGLAIEIGADGAIAVQIADVGYGLLDPIDEVTIFGSWSQEIVVVTEDKPTNIYVTGSSSPTPTPATFTWKNITAQQWKNITAQQWKAL